MPSPDPRVRLTGRPLLAIALAWSLGAVATAPPAIAATETPAEKIESRLMCYCGCTDLTVHVCNCGTAAGIKGDIRDRLAQGQTPDQVVAAYVARYGEQIRSAPGTSGFNLLAWVMPFAVLFAAGAAVVLLVRRWGAHGGAASARHGAPGTAGAAAPDRKTIERIERAIRESL
jgi:cytochrome c-type biogenesis protein CcmH